MTARTRFLPVRARLPLVTLALAATSCAGGCLRSADSGTKPAVAEAPTAAAMAVSVAPVSVRPVPRVLKFVGTLYGHEEITLSSQVEGRLRAVHADLGDRIAADQVLAEIEDDQLRARLRETEAMLAKARADEARGRELAGGQVISPQEYEAMKTAAAVAEAQRDLLNILTAHTRVRSPLHGSVAQRLVSAGEYVRPGTPLFKLVADHPLKLRGDVPERFAAELAPGQPVEIGVDAYSTARFTGRLDRISPAANPQNRSITVEVVVDNEARQLKPGFFAHASIVTRADDQALFVPAQALLSFAGVTKLFVVRDGVAHQTPVRTGTRGAEGYVEIVEGLYADETVVTSNLDQLEDGAAVTSDGRS
jgi:membrane fusion protein (multidrug efflux system)